MSLLPRNQLELDELSGVLVERDQGGLVLGETTPLDLEERAHEPLSSSFAGAPSPVSAAATEPSHGSAVERRRAAPGLNGSLKSRDRSLVIGGEPQDVVAVETAFFFNARRAF